MTIAEQIHDFGKRARAAARQLRQCSAEQKNAGLRAMADEIASAEGALLEANAQDVEKAKASGLSGAMGFGTPTACSESQTTFAMA